MSIETKNLNALIENRTFVDLYTDRYQESIYGFIIDFNDTFLLLNVFDSESKPDGIAVFFRENITRMRWGGNDISSTFYLIDDSNKRLDKDEIDLSTIQSVLKSVQAKYGYICVHVQDMDSGLCFIGEYTEMDDDTIILKEYGTKSALDRINLMISIGEITKVEGGGQYEEGLVKLFNNAQ